jgi:hypothetical protein
MGGFDEPRERLGGELGPEGDHQPQIVDRLVVRPHDAMLRIDLHDLAAMELDPSTPQPP